MAFSRKLKRELKSALCSKAMADELETSSVRAAANVAACAVVDATDLATALTLVNALKVTLNAEIAALKAGNIQASS